MLENPGGEANRPHTDDSGLSDQYEDLLHVASGRAGELGSTLVDVIRRRPALAAVLLAVGAGAVIGVSMARRRTSAMETVGAAIEERAETAAKHAREAKGGAGRRLGRVTDYGELLALGVKLLENPVVRGILVQAVARRLAKRLK